MHFISEIFLSLPVLFLSEMTSLLWAAHGGHVEACKLLISERADVNARSNTYLPLPCTFFQNVSLILDAFYF
jgi:ankyrin repeat protein